MQVSPREAWPLTRVLNAMSMKMGRMGLLAQPRRGPQAGKSRDPRSQNADRLSRFHHLPIPPAPHLPHSSRKPPLTFFLTSTENACSYSSTPTENPSPPSSPLAPPLGSSLATLLIPMSSA